MTTPSYRVHTRKSRQSVTHIALAALVGVVFADVITHLVFASLGQTPAEPSWNYVLALYFCLAVTATGIAVNAVLLPRRSVSIPLQILSAAAAGALTGFYYGGSLTNNNAGWAIAGAVLLGGLAAVVSGWFSSGRVAVALAVAGTIAAYGFTFVLWSWAVAFLTTHHLLPGISLTLLTILYLWLTVQNLMVIPQEIRRS